MTEIPYNKVLTRLGYISRKTIIDKKIEDLIHEEIKISHRLINPRQVIAFSVIKILESGQIYLEPNLAIKSIKLFDLLKDCSVAYGFAVTIGKHLEEKYNDYINTKETNKALVLDAIGSVAVEELAEDVQQQIAKTNKNVTRRFSPGYGDWELSGQKDFLLWLAADKIGIQLNNNFEMLPEKSISAIFGLTNQ